MSISAKKNTMKLEIVIAVIIVLVLVVLALFAFLPKGGTKGSMSPQEGNNKEVVIEGGETMQMENANQSPMREEEREKEGYKRKNLSFLKFVSAENCMYSLDERELNDLKDLGINGIRICPEYIRKGEGEIEVDIPEFVIVNLIRKAHNAGLAVFLEVNAGGKPDIEGNPSFVYGEGDIEALHKIATKWAEIGEREGVELYSPLNEPNLMFRTEKDLLKWINTTQDLHSYFKGGLVLKIGGIQEVEDVGEYDYLAFDIMWGDKNYRELEAYIDEAVGVGTKIRDEHKLDGFFFGELGAERSKVDKETQAEIFREVLNRTWGKTEGYCFLGWSNLEFRFRDNDRAKQVIAKWYRREAPG